MLKVLSGEKIYTSSGETSLRFFAYKSCLFIVSNGSVSFDGNTLGEGEAFYLRAGARISIEPRDDGSYFKFELDGNDSEELIKSYSAEHSALLVSSAPSQLLELAEALCSEGYNSGNDAFDEAAAKLLLSVLSPVGANTGDSKYGNQYVDRAVRYIERNYAQKLRVEALAETLGIDRMYLRNLFTRYVGMSTMDYIMQVRISHARELLALPELSVSSVALAVGYSDVLCFSKAFKKATGVSPTEFREGLLMEKQKQEKKANQIPVFIL